LVNREQIEDTARIVEGDSRKSSSNADLVLACFIVHVRKVGQIARRVFSRYSISSVDSEFVRLSVNERKE
jgi:hypothetical protein